MPSLVSLVGAPPTTFVHVVVADLTALKAIGVAERGAGMVALVRSTAQTWWFHATSTAADASESLVATPIAGSGRWLLLNPTVTLSLPITFATADAVALFVTPAGAKLKPREAWWEVTADFTGGVLSAIGAHTSVTGFDTKGDLLGGVTGDVAATLVASATRMVGTIGVKLATLTLGRLLLLPADEIRFGRITSVFDAGTGRARVLCDVVQNLGA